MRSGSEHGAPAGSSRADGDGGTAAESRGTPVAEVSAVAKRFPGVKALQGASLAVYPGEVHCLVGENGAGKSTLVKVLAGVHRPDEGTVWLQGRKVQLRGPSDALRRGVSTIYQECPLASSMTVTENILLGREPTRGGVLLRRRQAARIVHRLLADLGVTDIAPDARVARLGIAQQQIVEIAKALSLSGERLLIMDEPTAVLTARECERLFALVDRLRGLGVGILYITHRLEELDRIADTVTVMRDGRTVSTDPSARISRKTLIERMIGRPFDDVFPERRSRPGPPVLTAGGLTVPGAVREVSLTLRGGEIVGLFGLVGAGRTELARVLAGAERGYGDILLAGKPVRLTSPAAALRAGIGFVPEDRKRHGIVPRMSVGTNIALSSLRRLGRGPLLTRPAVRALADSYVGMMDIRPGDPALPIGGLSGGNQQKAVIARVLASNPRIVVLDEPTRGVDIGARTELYKIISALAGKGIAILLITSDALEAIGLSDRILVMRKGRLVGEVAGESATEHELMNLAFGQEPAFSGGN